MSCTNPNCECKTGSYANLNPPRRVDVQVEAIQRIVKPRSKGKVVYEFINSGYKVQLRKRNANSFDIHYGAQAKPSLTYAEAAKELGQCIMHALACEGKLD